MLDSDLCAFRNAYDAGNQVIEISGPYTLTVSADGDATGSYSFTLRPS